MAKLQRSSNFGIIYENKTKGISLSYSYPLSVFFSLILGCKIST